MIIVQSFSGVVDKPVEEKWVQKTEIMCAACKDPCTKVVPRPIVH